MQVDNNIGIYCIENKINHKKYIGQSINIEYRWKRHIRELNNNSHINEHLQKSWNKYGQDNFNFYVIEFCDADKLDELEVYYIDLYKTMDAKMGYNLVSGGNSNKFYSEEVKNKIGMASKGRKYSNETRSIMSEIRKGEKNAFFGKHHSEETKKIMSKNHTDVSGENNPRCNLDPVVCIDTGKIFSSAYIAGKEIGLYSSGITKCCKGKLKTTGGYRFKFLENNIC